jgi:G3E family GTPase
VADPEAIHGTLKLYIGPPIESTKIVIIVDAERYEVIAKALERPLKNQLKAAHVIIINKMDRVKPEVLSDIESKIRESGVKAEIIPASATEGTNLDKVVEAMVG